MVIGTAFTPDSPINVALFDQTGDTLYQANVTVASRTVFGLNGSQDPAIGYRLGGSFSVRFQGLCGATVAVRAYDVRAAAWSNWLAIAVPAIGISFSGPSGSQIPQNPAVGFGAGC
jgi:hypothetical protein